MDQEVVEVEAELVGAVEVTDCDVTHLSLECAQVGSVLNIVTLGHSLANELGGEVGHTYPLVAAVGRALHNKGRVGRAETEAS